MEYSILDSSVEVTDDVNDAFDSIVLSEEHICKEGFDEGYKKGVVDGKIEGYHLGYHRGAEIGAELGYYKGVAEALLFKRKIDLSNKIIDALEKVIYLVNQMPDTNTDEFDILSHYNNIKVSFKKACALLKINATFPESSKLSF
ncbi:hypothetical protein L9F63_021631 [Diploptera punctata]|uniref:Essential protein Yae1 N-terminal domain-containing protein n=1 Tax=Diploptera punctata TaxID=6984 RepID=A0AAD7ZPY0_DIPPU|nr:hypothetical protein L9F63_021631 [Diploptera punctata]